MKRFPAFSVLLLVSCHPPEPPRTALSSEQIVCVFSNDTRKDIDTRGIAVMCGIDTGAQTALESLRAETESVRMQEAYKRRCD